MTLDELRDWHARRAGWTYHPNLSGIGGGPNQHPATGAFWTRGNESVWVHPFPPTLDAADASFPQWWDWSREYRGGSVVWFASSMAEHPNTKRCHTIGTDSKIHDLYELSKLAWEQEQALAAACKEVGGNG